MQRILLPIRVLVLAAPSPGRSQEVRPSGADSAAADRLRPGDIIRLRIWREPELSGEFPVSEAGVAVFPRMGPLSVTEDSPETLRERLVSVYGEFLQHSSVEVVLLRRLQVLGAVRNPGLYPADGTLSVSDVLALAGGTTAQGDPRRIELLRNGTRINAHLARDTRISELQIRSGDQLYVPERGWLSRNAAIAAAGLTASASLIVTLLLR
jgi:protein involved in polysaccharide export with SLBB domain